MAFGKAIGEYSLKSVSSTQTVGPAGSILIQVNWEGTATGFGELFSTATYVGGQKGGTFSLVSAAYLDNGDALNGIGQGTYESSGKHRWNTKAIIDVSDGRRIAGVGELDLALRSWKGELFEA